LQGKCSHNRNLLEQQAPEVLLERVVRLAQLRLRLEVVQPALAVQQERVVQLAVRPLVRQPVLPRREPRVLSRALFLLLARQLPERALLVWSVRR
jgi:hypothetical protein